MSKHYMGGGGVGVGKIFYIGEPCFLLIFCFERSLTFNTMCNFVHMLLYSHYSCHDSKLVNDVRLTIYNLTLSHPLPTTFILSSCFGRI